MCIIGEELCNVIIFVCKITPPSSSTSRVDTKGGNGGNCPPPRSEKVF